MRFLYNAPAVFHKGALIIGDTHFGIEDKLRKKGIFKNDFSESLVEKVIALVKKTKVKKIIFLGDVKEDITYIDDYTKRAFSKLRDELPKITIIVVRGNHDGGIEALGNEADQKDQIRIIRAEGFVYENIALVHGHSWPAEKCMQARYLIAAHQHPQIEFIDSSGKRHTEPVWIIADADEKMMSGYYKKFNKKIKLIIMPAFNPLIGSKIKQGIKSERKDENASMLGPILNNNLFKWNDAIIYRLNGVAVGRLKTLR